jgi:uncharacterized protein (DUF305 family)
LADTVTLRILLVCLAAATCGVGVRPSSAQASRPPIVQPGSPGEASRTITAVMAADLSSVQHTPADVRFMQGMIGHHAQALAMTELRPSRSTSNDVRLLALRIELSQADEIRLMQDWLKARKQEVPDPQAHHDHHAVLMPGVLMPGMLTPEQMARLGGASGAEFDRLFLEFMIQHHAGALTMVEELFGNPGAGQEPEIFAFASDAETDQRMEIDRMGAMLRERQK